MTATTPLDVLIVDDSAAIRKILQRVLRQTDLLLGDIAEAGDGAEAVEILQKRSFGLILSDINMPQMDGLQLLARIKEMAHLKDVPVIMITTEGGQGKVMFRPSWKWRKRSPVKIAERTREEAAKALHSRRKSRHFAAAFGGERGGIGPVRGAGSAA